MQKCLDYFLPITLRETGDMKKGSMRKRKRERQRRSQETSKKSAREVERRG